MIRAISCLTLCFVTTLQASAQQLPTAQQPPAKKGSMREAVAWSHVEQLAPGQPIVLLQPGSNRRFECDVERVDDSVLTCIPFGDDVDAPQRMVFARSQISRIWVFQQVSGRTGAGTGDHAAALGGILGGIAIMSLGETFIGAVFVLGTIALLIAFHFVGRSHQDLSTQQVLIYKAH